VLKTHYPSDLSDGQRQLIRKQITRPSRRGLPRINDGGSSMPCCTSSEPDVSGVSFPVCFRTVRGEVRVRDNSNNTSKTWQPWLNKLQKSNSEQLQFTGNRIDSLRQIGTYCQTSSRQLAVKLGLPTIGDQMTFQPGLLRLFVDL